MMGLDMYAYSVDSTYKKEVDEFNSYPSNERQTLIDLNHRFTGDLEEIASWRKHNALHNWMEDLYREKGFTDDFNCTMMELTREDILRLKDSIDNNNLTCTSGFFFGDTNYMENGEYEEFYKDSDLSFIEEALDELDDGRFIYYESWW